MRYSDNFSGGTTLVKDITLLMKDARGVERAPWLQIILAEKCFAEIVGLSLQKESKAKRVQSGEHFQKEEHEDRSRVGVPTSLAMHDMGLATIIGPIDKDASGKPLSASMKSTIERLRTWDSRSQVHEPVDRNFRQAFSEADRLKDKTGRRRCCY